MKLEVKVKWLVALEMKEKGEQRFAKQGAALNKEIRKQNADLPIIYSFYHLS